MPAAGASISAPIGAVTSMPSCGRARWRMGWIRSAAKALEIHPLVGMIDGVAASRSRCLASEPYASFSDRTRMRRTARSEEHTSELQSRPHLVCRLLLEKKNNQDSGTTAHQLIDTPNADTELLSHY